MRRSPLWIIMAVAALGLCFGCGGDAGQPGSSGFEDTGSQLNIQFTSTEPNVDCFRDLDCNDDGETDDPEDFTDQMITATFTATTYYNPTDPGFDPEDPGATGSGSAIYLERYTIDYVLENPAGPPLRPREIYHTIVIPAPEDEDTPSEVIDPSIVLADLQTKREFREAISGGGPIIGDPSSYPTRYNVVYNFYGQNEFGQNVHVIATTNATFGNFDNCEE